ncbi:sensor histidine kinase [uncultured Duncaniella sp.]|uniref:sensor histidine kinase n=1 Tax=uncultured Duncaniella sp. TaxID=2768039 RepID=UPI0025D2C1D5|nr:histidine kinase [uncultured Duncaniella sp.]
MQHKYIVLFIIVISISFIPFIGIYSLMSDKPENLMDSLLTNLPVCLLIGGFDYFFIKKTAGLPIANNSIRLIIDLIATTTTCVFIICVLNYLLTDFTVRDLIRSALPAIPWNWVVTLLIELFFYNNRQQEIEREKANYQLFALRNQINPHFLFNSLNVLASLAYTDGEKANIFTKRLSAVYRYLLSNRDNRTVGIDEELDFTNKYLYLEQVRFGDSIKVSTDDMRSGKTGSIIPASIQMLVENAIKHNMFSKELPLELKIVITDTEITVSNNLRPRNTSAGTGIGLQNIERQYALHNKQVTVSRTGTDFKVTIPVIAS